MKRLSLDEIKDRSSKCIDLLKNIKSDKELITFLKSLNTEKINALLDDKLSLLQHCLDKNFKESAALLASQLKEPFFTLYFVISKVRPSHLSLLVEAAQKGEISFLQAISSRITDDKDLASTFLYRSSDATPSILALILQKSTSKQVSLLKRILEQLQPSQINNLIKKEPYILDSIIQGIGHNFDLFDIAREIIKNLSTEVAQNYLNTSKSLDFPWSMQLRAELAIQAK